MRILFVFFALAIISSCSNRDKIQIVSAQIIGDTPSINNKLVVEFNEPIESNMYVSFIAILKDSTIVNAAETGFTNGDGSNSFNDTFGSFIKKGSSQELWDNLNKMSSGNVLKLTISLNDSDGLICTKTFENL